ncbi:MAG TPA: ABC transporter permease [Thermoanaerobaculia bacterium]|nr:ABC transporter permease [Thermoanaerobaculia bacterium]
MLLLWHFAVVSSGTRIFPSPADVARAIVALAQRSLLWSYIRDSLFRVGSGYLAAVIVGVPLGMLLGWYRWLDRAANPVVQMLRPISPLAWMPLAVIWFGVSNAAPIFLIFVGSLFPIIVASANAVRNVPPVFLRAGRNFGLTTPELLRRVIFPSVLPQLLSSLRIVFGVAWIVLVAAEMIAVDSGLGYLIIDARNAGKRYDLVVAGMLLIGTIGLLLDSGFRVMLAQERR